MHKLHTFTWLENSHSAHSQYSRMIEWTTTSNIIHPEENHQLISQFCPC